MRTSRSPRRPDRPTAKARGRRRGSRAATLAAARSPGRSKWKLNPAVSSLAGSTSVHSSSSSPQIAAGAWRNREMRRVQEPVAGQRLRGIELQAEPTVARPVGELQRRQGRFRAAEDRCE